MNNNCLFSILIPNYGLNPFLFDCLDSVIKQTTFGKFKYEIILCDQSDNEIFEKILDQRNKKYPNIQILHSDIKGLFRARHTLMEKARGEYICFVDSDDCVDENYLYSLYTFINKEEFPEIIVTSFKICTQNNEIVRPDKKLVRIKEKEIKNLFFYSSRLNNIWRKCFKRSLYDKKDYVIQEVENGEDWVFSFPLISKAQFIKYSSNIDGYRYRIYDQSMTHIFSVETGLKQISLRDSFYAKQQSINYKQKCLITETSIKMYSNVATRLLKNNGVGFDMFKKFSENTHDRIVRYCGFFSKKQLTLKERIIFYCLYYRRYSFLFSLFKSKEN